MYTGACGAGRRLRASFGQVVTVLLLGGWGCRQRCCLQSPVVDVRYLHRMAILTETSRSKRSVMLAYMDQMQAAMRLLREEEIEAGVALLARARQAGKTVYVCGNGGSAATASHLALDLARNTGSDPTSIMRVMSLTDNAAWLTAVGNDQGYQDCFADQLYRLIQPDDLLIAISASGDSQSVVRAFEVARKARARRLALIGFDGGRLAGMATARIWVDSHDYGVVESVHLAVCHLLVRMLREGMAPEPGVLAQRQASAGELRRTGSKTSCEDGHIGRHIWL